MLNRQKLLGKINNVEKQYFLEFAKEQDIARNIWNMIKADEGLSYKVHQKKHSLLLPKWNGSLGFSKKIISDPILYSVLAVDGSQVYYDKHQGIPCYLLNMGTVFLDYREKTSSVSLDSDPYLFFTHDDIDSLSAEFVNLQREEYELKTAWQRASTVSSQNFVTLFDGSLIFFHLDTQSQDQKQKFLKIYFNYLQKFYESEKLIAGYMSFPRTKELVNIIKLILVQYDEKELQKLSVLNQLTDMDISSFYLDQGFRSTVFESVAPVSYLYPKESKPYFCYVNTGYEIVRIEFPAWIAQKEAFVDMVCKIAYDQAIKGRGYPVCLFEAHEQAVIKGYDREFFYTMIKKVTQKNNGASYKSSYKSLKKLHVPV